MFQRKLPGGAFSLLGAKHKQSL